MKISYTAPNCKRTKGYRFSDDGPFFAPGKLYKRSLLRGYAEEGMIMEDDGLRVLGYYRRRVPTWRSRFGAVHVRWIGIGRGRMKNFHYSTLKAALDAADGARREANLP